MNSKTRRQSIAGPVGVIECAIDEPQTPVQGLAVVCHPHPLHGGTMDNKVVQTLVRAFLYVGCRAVRFNVRGVGASEGVWDEGRGEVEDALAVVRAFRQPGQTLMLGGFSFGGYVASQVAQRLPEGEHAGRLVLVAPAVANFPVGTVPPGTVVFHGEADEVVPLHAAFDWARPQHLPITVLPGVGHFFHGQLAVLKQLVILSLSSR
jgi:alpha/beta superfamily hydrolase